MELATLHKDLINHKIESMYIFTGVEIQAQRIYIKQIADELGLQIVRPNSLSEIYNKLQNTSFIKVNRCYVIMDDMEFMNNEKAQENVGNVIGENVIIFVYSSIDKRLKFAKKYKDVIVDFQPLSDILLKKYIAKEINLSEKNMDKLIDVCESDYCRILLEIDKINHYIAGSVREYGKPCTVNVDEVFEHLINNGTIYQPPQDAIFDLVDAILKHKVKRSFELLEQCYVIGEATLVMLSVLYTNTKQVLQVQSCTSKDVEKTTGLTSWQVKCARDKCNVYSNGDLVYLMRLIQKVEEGIKTGRIEDEFAMDYILVNIL